MAVLRTVAAALSVATLVLGLTAPPSALAARFSVELTPAQIELTLEPGTSSPQWVGVRNHAENPIDLTVLVRDFDLRADGSFEMLEPGHTTYSAGKWLDFPVATMRLAPDETRIIDYTIVVPEDAESGGHYAAIVFEGVPVETEGQEGTTGVQIVGQVVGQVLITIPGPITRNLVIESLAVPSVVFGAGADTATVRITNNGNVHLTPNGYVQTWGGLPSGSFDEAFGQFTLLPGASRDFQVKLQNVPWLGRMKAKTELQFGPRIGMFDHSVETSVDYYVLSWKVILLLSILLIGFDIALFREWRRRVALRKAAPTDETNKREPETQAGASPDTADEAAAQLARETAS
ncbi:MAG: hypothetical protein KKA32_04595 [Actinobacteria bacterium]|nr:hypothetical protein [Actinomycetota bacterium]